MRKLAALALIVLGVGIGIAFLVFNKSDFTKATGEFYLEEKIFNASEAQSIRALTSTNSIHVVRGQSEDIVVRLEGNASQQVLDRIKFDATVQKDTLVIESSEKNRFGFNLSFGININSLKLIIELPEKQWDTLEVQSDIGHIVVEELKARQAKISSDVGNLKATDYQIQEFTLLTDTGNVTLIDGSGKLTGESDIGNIRIETDQLRDDLSLQSSTGSIHVLVDQQPESASIQLQTDIGSTNIDWEGFIPNSNERKKVAGSIGNGGISIDITTDIGSIKLGNR